MRESEQFSPPCPQHQTRPRQSELRQQKYEIKVELEGKRISQGVEPVSKIFALCPTTSLSVLYFLGWLPQHGSALCPEVGTAKG